MLDPFVQFKAAQKEGWGLFAPFEALTTPPAACLVEFAGVKAEESVLDVACGTGVVAVTAARLGARVKGLDFALPLLERARWNAATAGVEIDFVEGDAEALPYPDRTFDVVLSQFGHMFAPRPEVVVSEMLRVLKPGGRIAFSTWPPELFTGRMFALVSEYIPPPEGVAPPPQWGDPAIVRQRLGEAVTDLRFSRELMYSPALSPQHFRIALEATAGPLIKLAQVLKNEPARHVKFRSELEALIDSFTKENRLHQHFLMSTARKR